MPPETLRYVVMKQIDLIHDTRHLCMHIRSDMIKAMSHPGISGGKQIKFADTSNRSQVPLFSQIKTMILVCKMYKIIEFLLTVMTSTLFTWPL